MSKKGFTLAEILGVIVVITLLLLLIMPTLINKIAESGDKAGTTGDNLIFAATDNYIDENNPNNNPGTYCIPIKNLIDDGKLVKPVIDVKTGKDISDKTVFVTIDEKGNTTHKIVEEKDCKATATINKINFIVNPSGNKWVHERKVIIVYPKLGNSYNYQYQIDNGPWQNAKEGNYEIPPFRKISKLKARAVGANSISNDIDIINIDNELPTIKNLTIQPNSRIQIKAVDNISGIIGYYISETNQPPTVNDKNWIKTDIKAGEEATWTVSKGEGTYYIFVKDKAGNISPNNNNTITLKNKTATAYFVKGKNVLSIDSTSKSCTILAGNTGCQITLPNIVPNIEYITDGWYKENSKIGKVGEKYTINGDVTLTGQAIEDVISLTLSTVSTTNTITVVSNATALSDIVKYEFSIDNGKTWIDSNKKNTHTFSELIQNTLYNITVRVSSSSGKTKTTTKTATTKTIPLPTFSETGTTTKTVTITYPNGCGDVYTCTYQKNNGEEVIVNSKTAKVKFTDDGTVVAKVSDGTNKVSSSYNVSMYINAIYHPETWTCPSGYTKSGSGSSTKCSKTTTTNATRTTTYSCPSGYTKSGSGSSTKCLKTTTTTIDATESTTKKCSGSCYLDYTGKCNCNHSMQLYHQIKCNNIEGSKQSWRNYVNGFINDGYSCECNVTAITSQGYSGSGNECYKNANKCSGNSGTYYDAATMCHKYWTETPSTTTSYTCPSGYQKTGSGSSTKCKKETTTTTNPTTSYKYTCPSGSVSSGSGSSMKCKKTTTTSPNHTNAYYSCPSGYTLSGTLCYPN